MTVKIILVCKNYVWIFTLRVSQLKKAELTGLSQYCSHLILSGIDVAGRPTALSPQGTECLNQHLRRCIKRQSEKDEGQTGVLMKTTLPRNSVATGATLGSNKGYNPLLNKTGNLPLPK